MKKSSKLKALKGGKGNKAGIDSPKNKAKTKAKTKAKPSATKTKKQGVGAFAMDLIRKNKTNDQILAEVKKQFPAAKTTVASIAWYRNKLRQDGEKISTARELKKKAS